MVVEFLKHREMLLLLRLPKMREMWTFPESSERSTANHCRQVVVVPVLADWVYESEQIHLLRVVAVVVVELQNNTEPEDVAVVVEDNDDTDL